MTHPDDSPLLARLRAGEEAAFDELVRSHGGRMLAVARRYLASEDDARDAVQDAFLSAFRAIGRFEGNARLSTWLHRITVNAALMKIRSRRRRPEQSIEELLPRFEDGGHMAEPAVPWVMPAEAVSDQMKLRDLVHGAIATLPESYRTVLLLRDIEEYDTEQAARALGLSAGAVKTRLHRARQALRTLLEPHFREVEP